MRDEVADFIETILFDVLAKQAFVFPERTPKEELPEAANGLIQANIGFLGPHSGKLSLVLPCDMALEIAANILGTDPNEDLSGSCAEDALKEMVNVLCGHLRKAFLAENSAFRPSLPEASRLGIEEWRELLRSPQSIGFLMGDQPMLLILALGKG
jgi:CheY-specific phosphatase CheX